MTGICLLQAVSSPTQPNVPFLSKPICSLPTPRHLEDESCCHHTACHTRLKTNTLCPTHNQCQHQLSSTPQLLSKHVCTSVSQVTWVTQWRTVERGLEPIGMPLEP